MTETGVPYQAGEAPAEKSLGQVSFAALCGVLVDQGWSATALDSWEALDPSGRQEHEAIARAVEAEVLRRAVAHLERVCDEPWPHSVTVEKVLDALRDYAVQQEGQT